VGELWSTRNSATIWQIFDLVGSSGANEREREKVISGCGLLPEVRHLEELSMHRRILPIDRLYQKVIFMQKMFPLKRFTFWPIVVRKSNKKPSRATVPVRAEIAGEALNRDFPHLKPSINKYIVVGLRIKIGGGQSAGRAARWEDVK
jgi:hypothetical protein